MQAYSLRNYAELDAKINTGTNAVVSVALRFVC